MQQHSKWHTAALAALLALAAVAAVHGLFVGLEIDEQYALSLSYRLLRGDRLLYTMWEPHQFSALPLVPLLALFMAVTGGTAGILLFVRVVMLIVRAALGVWTWRLFRRALPELLAVLLGVGFALYIPKWFYGPDYTGQQYLFTWAALLCLYSYYAGPRRLQKPWQVVLGAVCACFGYLAFPQSIVAAAPLFAGMWVLGARGGEPRLFGKIPRGAALFAGTCVLCGAAFLTWVLTGLPVSMLLPRLAMILNDPQYSFTFGQRLAQLARQAVSVLRFLAAPLALALVPAAVRFAAARRRGGACTPRHALDDFCTDACILALLWCTVYAVRDGSMDMRQFTPVLTAAGGWVFWADRRDDAKRTERAALFWLGYLPGVVAYLFILRSTLLGLAPTFMYLTLPALCGMAALALRPPRAKAQSPRPDGSGAGTVLGLFLVFLACTRLFTVQVTGWKEHSVWDTPLARIPDGPAAGIWADAAAADMQAALTAALAGAEPGDDLLLCMAYPYGLAYLMNDGVLHAGQASVISGTDYYPIFSDYYREFPDKLPEIIVYDNNSTRDAAAYRAWLKELTAHLPVASRSTVIRGTASLDVLYIKK